MSTGQPIEVTFHTAPPPLPSYFRVHRPDVGPGGFGCDPQVIATEAGLVLLRVSVRTEFCMNMAYTDHFVYMAATHPRRPSLHLLPPTSSCFSRNKVALLRCGDAGDYSVAALMPKGRSFMTRKSNSEIELEFVLHLYRNEAKRWTSKLLRVEEGRIRDRLCPIPPDLDDSPLYHDTNKTITLKENMVAWVDLWRGILLCNVLDEKPVLRDVLLPLPARGNRRNSLQGCPQYIRDVTVTLCKDSIKSIEMEIHPSRMFVTPYPRPASYHDCLSRKPSSTSWVRDGWKATTWTLPIPVSSWHERRPVCTIDVGDLTIANPEDSKLLNELRNHDEAELGNLLMAYPTMSLDADVLYLISSAYDDSMEAVVAVDLMEKTEWSRQA